MYRTPLRKRGLWLDGLILSLHQIFIKSKCEVEAHLVAVLHVNAAVIWTESPTTAVKVVGDEPRFPPSSL